MIEFKCFVFRQLSLFIVAGLQVITCLIPFNATAQQIKSQKTVRNSDNLKNEPGIKKSSDVNMALSGPELDDMNFSASRDNFPWEQFNDSVLKDLVEKGLADNPGIKAAKERIAIARAGSRSALAPLLPSVSAEGMYAISSYDKSLMGMNLPSVPGMTPSTSDVSYSQTFTATLKAQYLIDITGRYYKNREAALKDAEAQIEDAKMASAVLATQIMQTYYDVVSAQARVELIEYQIENNSNLLKLVMAQFKRGIANALDVLQQKQQLHGKEAQLPLAKTFLNISKRELATLAGLDSVAQLPDITDKMPQIGKGPYKVDFKDIDNLRPDLRAAKERIDAYKNRTDSAKRALAPTLAISGQYGFKAIKVTDQNHGDIWNAGAVLNVPLFMGGINHANLDKARAATRSAVFALEDTRRKAITRIENSIEKELRQKEYLKALVNQYNAARQTVNESKKRYVAGLSTYLNVLAATGSLHLNELALIQAQRDLLKARINLLSSIGGNWTQKLSVKNSD